RPSWVGGVVARVGLRAPEGPPPHCGRPEGRRPPAPPPSPPAGALLPVPATPAEGRKPAAKKIPAFPGAEGAGMYTPGGRGGKVYLVRNLNDRGPGSLREAVEARGPRMVLFRVAGLLHIGTPLSIPHP